MIEGIVWSCLLITMLYSFWIRGLSKVWDEKVLSFFVDAEKQNMPSVSLVIPFRNEDENLPAILNDINQFDYPVELLECIFVDDHSDDNSVSVISDSKLKFPFKIIQSSSSGKKAAITNAVELAKNTWIVTTDADTRWDAKALRILLSHPKLNEVEMICGVVELKGTSYNLLDVLQVQEYAILQAAGISSLFRHEPLLNSGANLAFRKSSFDEVQGYQSHEHIASGDDVFLMLSFANKWNDSVVSNPNSKITTNTVDSWSAYLQQRSRWGMKARHYKDKNLIQIGFLFLLSNLGMVVMMFSGFFSFYYLLIFLIAVLFRFSAEHSLIKRYYAYYNSPLSSMQVLMLSVFYPIVFLMTLFSGWIAPGSWKGRKL
jgi:cellulose synthase/poly-beta-1,6-N-acetylglucosamine synthase-like glycosyltransferase